MNKEGSGREGEQLGIGEEGEGSEQQSEGVAQERWGVPEGVLEAVETGTEAGITCPWGPPGCVWASEVP